LTVQKTASHKSLILEGVFFLDLVVLRLVVR
jgi:hypothetical protein